MSPGFWAWVIGCSAVTLVLVFSDSPGYVRAVDKFTATRVGRGFEAVWSPLRNAADAAIQSVSRGISRLVNR